MSLTTVNYFEMVPFDGNGFENWKFKVKALLKRDGLLSILSEVEPAEPVEHEAWEKRNASAEIIIIGAVAESHLHYIREEKNAKAMWDNLELTFGTNDFVNESLIRRKIYRLHYNENMSFSEFLLEFDKLISQLTAITKVTEIEKIRFLFDLLPQSFDPLVTALENLKIEELKLSYVKSRILAEEEKRLDRDLKVNSSSFISASSQSYQSNQVSKQFVGYCYFCGQQGHKQYQCSEKSLHYRPGTSVVENEEKFASITYAYRKENSKEDDFIWVLDSGAADHQISTDVYFTEEKTLDRPVDIIVAKQGVSMKATKIGKLFATTYVRENKTCITLKEVLYVPELRKNLLSIRKMAQAGVEVKFVKGGEKALIIYEGKVIGVAWNNEGLYEWKMNEYCSKFKVANQESSKGIGCTRNLSSNRSLRNLEKIFENIQTEKETKIKSKALCSSVVQEKNTKQEKELVQERKKFKLEKVTSTRRPIQEGENVVEYGEKKSLKVEMNEQNRLCSKREHRLCSRERVLVENSCNVIPYDSEEGVKTQETVHANSNQYLKQISRSVDNEKFWKKFKMKRKKKNKQRRSVYVK